MSDEHQKSNSEVDEQLEYLFAEAEDTEGDRKGEGLPDPLRDLKAIFLAVDWEINDEIMGAMLTQIESLKKTFGEDRIMTLFLQLLGAVGKYIKSQKANAHPDAVKLLHSIYTSIEIVSMSEAMTEAERKRILRSEVERFKLLKDELAQQKDSPREAPGRAPEAESVSEPTVRSKEIPPALQYVLEELRRTIRDEFAALRKELRS